MNIYITIPKNETTFVTPRAMEALQKVGKVTRNESNDQLRPEEVIENAKDADIIVCSWHSARFTKEVVEKLPNLKILAYTGGSMAPVLDADSLQNGVIALTGNYVFAKSVAEGALAYLLCVLRELEQNMKLMREGGWQPKQYFNRGLFGKKVGLVGFGQIAKEFISLLQPFDVEILVNSGHLSAEEAAEYGVTVATKEEIFSTCDIVSLHLAQTEKTIGVINRELLGMLKQDAVLVNTSRGMVVDEEAMTEMVLEKRFYVALDVFATEPLSKESPLRSAENAMLIPHMAGPTIDMREHVVLSFAKDFEAFKEGKPMKNVFDISTLAYMSKKKEALNTSSDTKK